MNLTDHNARLPRLKLNDPMEPRELMNEISARSGLVPADVVGVIYELGANLLNCCRYARPLRLEGIGLFAPTVRLDGTIHIRFKPDKGLLKELNLSNNLKKHITHRQNLGKSLEELGEDRDA
ncbi:MAG TPA: hypothetical protein ENN17_08015 [bacterium]|nr:hypothetical protein [bacterium]